MSGTAVAAVERELLRPEVEFYLDLHAHPELSGQERRTAARLADRLAAHGCEVTRGVGGHGVVGVLRAGPGPTVLLRAELDALPVAEGTGLPYASEHPGAMHACGHDLHLAALSGAVGRLARARERGVWRGTVLAVGQPAEETLTGAAALLADGLYERFGTPDLVLAQHAAPLPAGTVAHAVPGAPLMAASVTLDVVVHGRGGHAGTPQLAVDPVVAAAAVVLRLQTVVARETAPADQVVVTVGALHAGERANVIPDRAELSLSIRALSEESLTRAEAAVRRVVTAECAASACPRDPEFTVTSRSPALVPDARATEAARSTHRKLLGPGRVALTGPVTATEDAGRLAEGGVPLAYWLLGTVGAKAWRRALESGEAPPANHSPRFAPDVRTALPTGIEALGAAALTALTEAKESTK